jgi:hypothetical protein
MKNCLLLLCFLLVFGLMSCSEKKTAEEKSNEQAVPPNTEILDEGVVIGKQLQEDTLKGSLKAYAKGKVGDAEFKITYHSPAVRGRIVWGGLVPFDRVWVTGAHMATTLESNFDFNLGKTVINSGKYGLFTIPGKDKWIVIINKNWQQHLTDEYDSKDDLARIEITPSQLPDNQERLQYEVVAKSAFEGSITMTWDKVRLSIPITVKNPNFD